MEMSKEIRMEKTRKLLLWILRLLLSDEKTLSSSKRNAMLYTFWMADPTRSMLVGLTG